MPGQPIADAGAAAEQHVEHARREQPGGQFGQFESGQRRLLRRLDHHAVARRQRRRQFPCRHHQRVVPRRDRGHHAERIAADHRGMPGQILAGRHAGQAAAGPGEEAKHVGHRRQFVVQHAVIRFAAVERLQPAKVSACSSIRSASLSRCSARLRRGLPLWRTRRPPPAPRDRPAPGWPPPPAQSLRRSPGYTPAGSRPAIHQLAVNQQLALHRVILLSEVG